MDWVITTDVGRPPWPISTSPMKTEQSRRVRSHKCHEDVEELEPGTQRMVKVVTVYWFLRIKPQMTIYPEDTQVYS